MLACELNHNRLFFFSTLCQKIDHLTLPGWLAVLQELCDVGEV